MTQLRNLLHPSDPLRIEATTRATGFFTEAETVIARELAETRLRDGEASGYHFVIAESDVGDPGPLLGYTCFGPIPATQSSYDLYWIVVAKECQRQGLGSQLLAHTERRILAAGGSRIYIDTAGRDLYRPTHAFYRRAGYEQVAKLDDFYAPGDAKLIFAKRLTQP